MFALFFLMAIFFMFIGGVATGDMGGAIFAAGMIAVIAIVLGLWVFIVSIKEK
jgi:hypothetical protein